MQKHMKNQFIEKLIQMANRLWETYDLTLIIKEIKQITIFIKVAKMF